MLVVCDDLEDAARKVVHLADKGDALLVTAEAAGGGVAEDARVDDGLDVGARGFADGDDVELADKGAEGNGDDGDGVESVLDGGGEVDELGRARRRAG